MKSINFCIPFIGLGTRYAEFLVTNLYETAEFPARISICVSAHTEADVAAIKNSSFSRRVQSIAMADPYPKNMLFFTSANHSRAINALAAKSESDITIFSDYDMAFLCRGWDVRIEEILSTHDLCGVAYPPVWTGFDMRQLPWLVNVPLAKYQQNPNLSFMAITKKCLDETFGRKLTDFDSFLANGGLPFQIVNTREMAELLKLPVGTIVWMDTGFELPFAIQKNNLNASTFQFAPFADQNIFSSAIAFAGGLDPETVEIPEVFCDGAPAHPFLAHFKKGSAKAKKEADFGFEQFKCAVTAKTMCNPTNQP